MHKNPKINVYFAFPAVESFAMASLGYLSIFKKLDLMEDVAVERLYSDTKTTTIPKEKVDIIGFSNSFEIDILQILNILKKFDIPYKASERESKHPLVFGGGPVLSANPLPFQEFYDFIIIGDAESSFDEVFKVLVEQKDAPKNKILEKLNHVECVWVPSLGKDKKVKRAVGTLKEPVYTPILSEKSFFKDTFVIEIERGCPKMCNFCLASWGNMPTRFVALDEIIKALDLGLKHTRKIALLGAYVAGHPDFDKILDYIKKQNEIEPIELSISSLRADLEDGNLIKTLVACGAKTATIAIEAGSERLRRVINKDLKQEQILKTVQLARENGLSGLKIYVMIGHPTETDEDIKELISLMKELKHNNKGFDLTLSLTTFIPKAQTPFQWCKKEPAKSLEKKIAYLKKELHKIGITLRPSSIEWDTVQAVLSRYGESLADYLIAVNEKGGNLGAFKQVWRTFYKESLEEKAVEAFGTPWDFIESAPKDLLRQAYEKVLRNQ